MVMRLWFLVTTNDIFDKMLLRAVPSSMWDWQLAFSHCRALRLGNRVYDMVSFQGSVLHGVQSLGFGPRSAYARVGVCTDKILHSSTSAKVYKSWIYRNQKPFSMVSL
jgi:hypothetical protein